jgi:hypothetical protein
LHIETHNYGSETKPTEKQIFAGLCFFTNGSTAPLVSDHKLKHILAAHGASCSITLGRRSVTHVILGTTSAQGGAGGGLAATKIQKEIARSGGKVVKFVTVEWYDSLQSVATQVACEDGDLTNANRVLESIKAQRRLSESHFSSVTLARKGQNSVFGMSRSPKLP